MPHKEIAVAETRPAAVWDPIPEFRGLSGLSEIFDEFLSGMPAARTRPAAGMLSPRVDIHENDREYVLKAALPGVKKEEVKIEVVDGVLSLGGEHRAEKEEKDKNWLRREIQYGCFQRSFSLPGGIHPEDVKAHFKDGMLTVTVHKHAAAKSRGVPVKVE